LTEEAEEDHPPPGTQVSKKGTSLDDGKLAFKSLLQTRHKKNLKSFLSPIEGQFVKTATD